MKKFTLVAAAFGLMMLAACGDDSSSNSSSTDKDAQGRTIYHDMIDAMEAPCSEANQCEEIIMDDPMVQDTLICLGTMFQSKIGRDLSKCGVTSADDPATDISPVVPATDISPVDPATDTPADVPADTPADAPADTPADAPADTPATDTPATDTPAAQGPTVYTEMSKALSAPCSEENKCEIIILNSTIAQDTLQCNGSSFQSLMGKANLPVCEEAAAADTPATEPAASEAGPTGDLVSCDFVAEGVLGEHSCVEAVASDAVVPAFCQTMGSMGEGMTATSGTSCNAPETALKCVKNGMNFYSLDGNSATCDEFFEASVLQGLAVSM